MSTHARARAAELLSLLSHPVRIAIAADLARRAEEAHRPLLVAEIAESIDVPIREAADAVARLHAMGVLERVGFAYTARLSALRDAAGALDAENPITAFLDDSPRLRGVFTHGRLVSMPDLSVHGHELACLLARLIAFDGTVGEPEINRRLAIVSDDVAKLRRLMVDEGVMVRDRAGTAYRMAPRARWDLPAVGAA